MSYIFEEWTPNKYLLIFSMITMWVAVSFSDKWFIGLFIILSYISLGWAISFSTYNAKSKKKVYSKKRR